MITFPTVREFLDARKVLTSLINEKMPYTTAVKIQRFLDNTDVIYNDYNVVMRHVAEKYLTKDENGKINVIPELKDEYMEIAEKILDEQLKYSFDTDYYLTDVDLKEINSIRPIDIELLKWMILDISNKEVV